MSDHAIWHKIRQEILSESNIVQIGPNLFCKDDGCFIIYTRGDLLSLKTLVDLVSKSKNNKDFKLPLTVITKSGMNIDEKCQDYINIMKKELKITPFNGLNS